jgi:hypothetical protein
MGFSFSRRTLFWIHIPLIHDECKSFVDTIYQVDSSRRLLDHWKNARSNLSGHTLPCYLWFKVSRETENHKVESDLFLRADGTDLVRPYRTEQPIKRKPTNPAWIIKNHGTNREWTNWTQRHINSWQVSSPLVDLSGRLSDSGYL